MRGHDRNIKYRFGLLSLIPLVIGLQDESNTSIAIRMGQTRTS